MISKTKLGNKGEKLAADFLKNAGMEILNKNFRYGHKEIDIIAKDEDTIVFVEVRARKSAKFGSAEESVTSRKQKLLIEAANFFISKNQLDCEGFRFDVVAIDMKAGSKILHIKNAFAA